jgi:Taurine catabolism dioxygenase TauD, TfdA family
MLCDSFARHYVDLRGPGHIEALTALLATDGLATFDGITDPAGLLTLASRLGDVVTHRDSDPDGVTTVTDTAGGTLPKPGYRAFSRLALFPHTDGTAQPSPPALLWLVCDLAAPAGGVSVLVDAADVWTTLAAHHPTALAALSTPGMVSFGGGPALTGAVFEPARCRGRLRMRFRNDELVHPAGAAAHAWPVLLEAIAAHRRELTLAAGQGFVACNTRWLHGRTAYIGRRRMLRVLSSQISQPTSLVIPDGFTVHATAAAGKPHG